MTAHILRSMLPDGTELCATAALVARALGLPVEVLDEAGQVLVRAEADGSFCWVGPTEDDGTED